MSGFCFYLFCFIHVLWRWILQILVINSRFDLKEGLYCPLNVLLPSQDLFSRYLQNGFHLLAEFRKINVKPCT